MPAAQAQHQVQGRLLLDVVVRERAAVLELLAREDEALLILCVEKILQPSAKKLHPSCTAFVCYKLAALA